MATSSFAFTWVLIALGNGLLLPVGIPPGPNDPALAAVAPADCLFYGNWSGTVAPDPKSTNATERLMAEPEVRQCIAGLEKAVRNAMRRSTERGQPAAPKAELFNDVLEIGKTVLSRPGAIYVSQVDMVKDQPPKVGAALVLNLGDAMETTKAALDRILAQVPPGLISEVEISGRKWRQLQLPQGAPAVVFGASDKYFVVAVGTEKPDDVLARLKGSPPAWLVELDKSLAIPRRGSIAYLNVKAVTGLAGNLGGPEVARVVAALGLDRVVSIAQTTGLDETGTISRSSIAIEPGAKGIFAALADRPLAPADLAPIPRDATFAVAARLDADRIWNTILAAVGRIDPRVAAEIDRELGEMQNALDLELREDVLKPLGDVWCLYNSPGDGGFLVTGLTLVVKVNDPARLGKTHERLLARIKAEFNRHGGPRGGGPAITRSSFAGREIFTLIVPERGFPLSPSWCLTDKELVVALMPQTVKAYLARPADLPSLAQAPGVAKLFHQKKGPMCVKYIDSPQLFQVVYPLVQMFANVLAGEMRREGFDFDPTLLPSARAIAAHLKPAIGAVYWTESGIEIVQTQTLPIGNGMAAAPIAVGLALPAWQGGREAARRSQSMNNLKQIALALHNYHDANRSFPPAYSTDKDGKPLLSWRVAILPYIEQVALYRQFHLDEPWDSQHNRPLLNAMPSVYRRPDGQLGPGRTPYLSIREDRSIFPGAKQISFADITDGAANTIMVVEASPGSAVEWTKPDDLPLNPQQPLRGLVGARPGGFLASMADGSVRFVSEGTPAQTLVALFTRNGGEVVSFPLDTPRRMPPQVFPGFPPGMRPGMKIEMKSPPRAKATRAYKVPAKPDNAPPTQKPPLEKPPTEKVPLEGASATPQ
jgi:hypothetical protein